jgi:hypothetical protein
MPLILTILSDFLKSTQPGIQAAEGRVKFLTLGENLVFRRTELIVSPSPRRQSDLKSSLSQDMDFYGENRTVAHEGTVGRKEKSDSFSRERWWIMAPSCWTIIVRVSLFVSFFLLMGASVILAEERTHKDPVKGTEIKSTYVNSRVRLDSLSSTERPLTSLVL